MIRDLHIIAIKRPFPVLFNRPRIVGTEKTAGQTGEEEKTDDKRQCLFHPKLLPSLSLLHPACDGDVTDAQANDLPGDGADLCKQRLRLTLAVPYIGITGERGVF